MQGINYSIAVGVFFCTVYAMWAFSLTAEKAHKCVFFTSPYFKDASMQNRTLLCVIALGLAFTSCSKETPVDPYSEKTGIYFSLEEALVNPDNVISLVLTNKGLTTFPEEIFQFHNLEELKLYGNKLTSIPSRIEELKKLGFLMVEDNMLKDLPSSLGNLKELIWLRADDNDIQRPPKELSQLPKFEFLFLVNNNIQEYPEDLCYIESLEQLDLTDNKIKTFPEKIRNLKSLKCLHLKGNPLDAGVIDSLKKWLPDTRIDY